MMNPAKVKQASDSTEELSAELGEYELVVTGNGSVARIPLVAGSQLLIGRGEDAHLRLASGSVSRRHLMASLRGAELMLEDLGSSNGTLVRGKRLTPRHPMGISPGESFLVGEFVLVLSVRRNSPRRTPEEPVWNDAAGAVIVHSSEMHAVYQQLDPIARSGINVLILGETGVGKDVLAENLHRRSDRRDKPFLRLNCAAFSESLLESELFGHEQGAFTGATQRKPGLLATASGGTVLLDEIGELPLCLQAKVLHVIETREVLSVGGIRPYSIDVRFLAATNRNLEQEAAIGSFRSDLYYRLATYSVVVPPLRNRRADILPLAREFLRRACLKRSTPSVPSIHPDTAAQLLDHPWPGNLRELRNVMERALVLSEGSPLLPGHLQLEAPPPIRRLEPASDDAADTRGSDLLPREIEERRRIIEALRSCAGNQSKAAARLGVSRSTLVNRLDVYRIGRPRKQSR